MADKEGQKAYLAKLTDNELHALLEENITAIHRALARGTRGAADLRKAEANRIPMLVERKTRVEFKPTAESR